MKRKLKAATLPIKELRNAHKHMAGALDLAVRIGHMRAIAQWYVTNGPYKGPVVVTSKHYQRAAGAVELGMRVDTPHNEAENSLRHGIRFFEQAFADDSLPKIADTLQEFEGNRPALEHKAATLNNRFAPFLETMNQLFAPLEVRFEIRADQEKPRVAGVDKIIRVSEAYAIEKTKDVKQNFFSVILSEVPVVVRALSIVSNGGALSIDLNLVNSRMQSVLETLSNTVRTTDKPVVAAPLNTPAPQPTASAAPRAPRAPRAQSSGTLFRAGTMTGVLYDRLMAMRSADGKAYTSVTSLIDGISSGDPNALINDLVTKGRKTGAYELIKHKSGALEFSGPALP